MSDDYARQLILMLQQLTAELAALRAEVHRLASKMGN
jgi:hypothetical protein